MMRAAITVLIVSLLTTPPLTAAAQSTDRQLRDAAALLKTSKDGLVERIAKLLERFPGLVKRFRLLFLLGFVLDFLEIIYIVVPIVGPVIYGGTFDPKWVTIMIAVMLSLLCGGRGDDIAARAVALVIPELTGEPARGKRVDNVSVLPATVTVSGENPDLRQLDSVATEPVDISGQSVELVAEVPLGARKRRGHPAGTGSAAVRTAPAGARPRLRAWF